MISTSHAAEAMPVKAMPAAEPVPFWWFHGDVEVGGRFFVNNPTEERHHQRGREEPRRSITNTRDLRPGPFGNVHLSTGTSDGLYQIDVRAKNIGYDDQRYELDASKAGEHYFNLQWDETPHTYSTDVANDFVDGGGGSNARPSCTTAGGCSEFLSTPLPCVPLRWPTGRFTGRPSRRQVQPTHE